MTKRRWSKENREEEEEEEENEWRVFSSSLLRLFFFFFFSSSLLLLPLAIPLPQAVHVRLKDCPVRLDELGVVLRGHLRREGEKKKENRGGNFRGKR